MDCKKKVQQVGSNQLRKATLGQGLIISIVKYVHKCCNHNEGGSGLPGLAFRGQKNKFGHFFDKQIWPFWPFEIF